MNIIIFLFITVYFTHVSCTGNLTDTDPSYIFRITQNGLDVITRSISSLVTPLVLRTKLPPLTIPSIGYTKIDLTDITITNFPRPTISTSLLPPDRISVEVSTGLIDATADWDSVKSVLFDTLADQGAIDLNVDQFRINFTIQLGDTLKNGLPSVSISDCSTHLGSINVNIRNATYNYFEDIVNTYSFGLKQAMNWQLCSWTKWIISSVINKQLEHVPDLLVPYPPAGLGYQYWIKPIITHDYIQITIKAIVNEISGNNPSPMKTNRENRSDH